MEVSPGESVGAAGSQSCSLNVVLFVLFRYNVDETPECNSCFCRSVCSKTGFFYVVLLNVAEPIDDVK